MRYIFKYFNKFQKAKLNFLTKLPNIIEILDFDLASFIQNDPAATSKAEIVLTYPGFYAIFVYRLAHQLALDGETILPRMMTEIAHSKTGIDIHPSAIIKKGFFIDHGTGIVIGETAVIGQFVKIYHGVTLGAKSVKNKPSQEGLKRHPTILDGVTLYANSTILGGDTIIGENVIVGSNTFITTSISDNQVVKLNNKNYLIEKLKKDEK